MMNFRLRKFIGGSAVKIRETKMVVSDGYLTALRDSEPKRALYAVGRLRYDAHVITNFRRRKFAGFCVIKVNETKSGYPFGYPLFVWRALRDSNPRPFGS